MNIEGKQVWGNPVVNTSDVDTDTRIEVHNNHIYFYSDITFESALALNKEMLSLSERLLRFSNDHSLGKPVIHLHVNSCGGYFMAGTAIMDTIIRLRQKVEIHTYVEGMVASAGTFVTLVGTRRSITRNSVMLIHQLSAGVFGNYAKIVDNAKNMDLLMTIVKKIYEEYTKVPSEQLEEILSHDLYFDPQTCLDYKLVDYLE